jgi:intracellular sulfur oxidation DsrE/DsrF family protein
MSRNSNLVFCQNLPPVKLPNFVSNADLTVEVKVVNFVTNPVNYKAVYVAILDEDQMKMPSCDNSVVETKYSEKNFVFFEEKNFEDSNCY